MIFKFSQWVVDIDVNKTREFYNNASLVSEGCSCVGCRNYEKAIGFISQNVLSFFSQFGIDMKKICEVYVNYTRDDDLIFYGGFYHICGKIISGENAWISTSQNTKHLDEDRGYSVTKDFTVLFQNECDLLEDNFPAPAIQLEILANIPWVLEEKNDYPKG